MDDDNDNIENAGQIDAQPQGGGLLEPADAAGASDAAPPRANPNATDSADFTGASAPSGETTSGETTSGEATSGETAPGETLPGGSDSVPIGIPSGSDVAAPDAAPDAAAVPVPVPVPDAAPDSPPAVTEPPSGDSSSSSLMTEALEREIDDAMATMGSDDLNALMGGAPDDSGEAVPGAVAPDRDPATIEPGTAMTGTVTGVSGDDVVLEFGVKLQGVLPRSQFGKKEVLAAGRRVDVIVERYDPDSDLLFVVRKGVVQRANWLTLTRGMIAKGRVMGVIKGGLEIDLNGIRAFMPASQVDVVPVKDISIYLGETIELEVMELDRRKKNVLVSRRQMLKRAAAEAKEQLQSELEVGQTHKGVVKTIMEYGAFVDIGGMDGLVHISDVSWSNIEKVGDVLSVGQEVEVRVLKIDTKRDRISLGIKQAQPNPWDGVEERFPVHTALKARIVRVVDFGAFAEVEPGVEALIPVSEMGWSRIATPADAVAVGDMVDVVVIRVEPERRRMALSMKQAAKDPWSDVLESFSPNSWVEGKVTRVMDFGAFVELVPGVEGLVHISEMAEERIRACSDVVKAEQVVKVRVLGVDAENRRIKLSLKAETGPAEVPAQDDASAAPAPKKKRKKPLRGGLVSFWDQ